MEEPGHLLGRLEVELGVRAPLAMRLLEGLAVAGRDEAVLQAMAVADVVVRVVGGDQRYAELAAKAHQRLHPLRVATHQVLLELKIEAVAVPLQVVPGQRPCFVPSPSFEGLGDSATSAPREGDEALGMPGQQRRVELRVAAVAVHGGEREQIAEVLVARGRSSEEGQVGAMSAGGHR